MAKKKHPTDINQRAKSLVDIATNQFADNITPKDEIKASAALRKKRRRLAKALSSKCRSEMAKKAAAARWDNKI
jgi:hypothetical protein